MLYVNKIESNVKSADGKKWSVDLGSKTLLVGPNESGKSAIVEALLLACTGSTSGLFLRPGLTKKNQDLIVLKPETEKDLFSAATFTSTLPIKDAERHNMGVWWGTSQDENGSIKRGKQEWSPNPFSVRFPLEELKTALRGSPDTAYRFLFENLLGDKKYALQDLLSYPEILVDFGSLKPYLPDLGFEWTKESSIVGVDFLEIIHKISSKRKKISAEAKQLEAALKSYTSIESVSGDGLLEKWESLFRSLRFEYLKKAYQNNEGLRGFISKELLELGSSSELKQLKGSAIISEEIEKFIEQRIEVRVAKNLKDRASSLLKHAQELGRLEKSLLEIIRCLVQTYLPNLCAHASRFLPKGEQVGFEATQTKIRFGIKRGGSLYQAMSGSTEVRVLAAIAGLLCNPLKCCSIIILDDRMWDAVTLGKTLAALDKCPAQVLVMSTVKPKGRTRNTWTYVELNRSSSPSPTSQKLVEELVAMEQAPLL